MFTLKLVCWSPNLQLMVLGGGGLWEAIRSWRWSPCKWDWCFYKEWHERWSVSAMWGHSKKTAICKPGKGPLPGKSASTVIWPSQPPELWEINFYRLTQSMGFCYSSWWNETGAWAGHMTSSGPREGEQHTRGHRANWGQSPLKSCSLFSKFLQSDLDQAPFLLGPHVESQGIGLVFSEVPSGSETARTCRIQENILTILDLCISISSY